MRGRVLLSLLLLLCVATPAFPKCNDFEPRHSTQFRMTAYDVLIDADNYLWVATGYGVQLYSPARELVSTIAIPDLTRALERNGSVVYAGSGDHVYALQRTGETLRIASRTFTGGGNVNDLALAGSYLFAATSNGIRHFDVFDAATPRRTEVQLASSRPNVTSLVVAGNTLYAADGDFSVEVISLALPVVPQNTGTIDSLGRSAIVHTHRGYLFVSDDLGQRTDIRLTGSGAPFAQINYGTNAMLPLTNDIYFTAGTDRAVRAIDTLNAQRPAELFEQQLVPTGGTNNRVYAFARSGDTVYAAAGDMGLIAFDVSALVRAPHPLTSYDDGPATSALLIGNDAFFTDLAGNIIQQTVDRNGIGLTPVRSWSAGTSSILHDHATTTLLSSNGATVKVWTIATQTAARTVTFPQAVKSAVLLNNTIVAVLANGSLWTAADTTPVQGTGTFDLLARSGTGVALADITDAGRTVISYFANGDLSAPVRTVDINGAATGGLALSSQYAVVFTFAGLNVIDLSNGNVRVLPDSHRIIPRALSLSGDDLVVLGDRTLTLWSAGTGERKAEHSLPSNAVAMGVGAGIAAIATFDGKAVAEYGRALPAPSQTAGENRYYTRIAAGGDRLYLFDGTRVDIFSVSRGTAPDYMTSVDAVGTIEVAASATGFFTLAANGVVTAYSNAGGVVAQSAIAGMENAQPRAIHVAGNAVWASFSAGCGTGTCQETTVILDPRTLAITSTITGRVRDLFAAGTRAYALLELPDELRVYDIANPAQPAQLAMSAAPAGARSISASGNFVYVATNTIREYTSALTFVRELTGIQFVSSDAAVRIDGPCAIMIGTLDDPDFAVLPGWGSTLEDIADVPSPVRRMAVLAGRAYLLTDHSLEVWMAEGSPAPPAKRRGVR